MTGYLSYYECCYDTIGDHSNNTRGHYNTMRGYYNTMGGH